MRTIITALLSLALSISTTFFAVADDHAASYKPVGMVYGLDVSEKFIIDSGCPSTPTIGVSVASGESKFRFPTGFSETLGRVSGGMPSCRCYNSGCLALYMCITSP